jgi:hypothetical protein
MPKRNARLFVASLLAIACTAPDERPEAEAPALGVLEVVLDDSAPPSADSGATTALFGGMCLRGDPSSGEPWTVERVGDTLTMIALEHLVDLAPRDSARLVARLTRTADALPGDTLVADFRGLPVVVRDAWRLVPEAGDTIYIAIASRRLPMESSPLEEQLTLIAMPEAPAATGALVASWFARSAGAEDSLETREPLLAYRAPDGTMRLLLLRETGGSPVVESLARVDQRWRRALVGSLAPCG